MPSEQMSYSKGFYYHQFQLEAPHNEHSYRQLAKLPKQAAQNEYSLKQNAILHLKTTKMEHSRKKRCHV